MKKSSRILAILVLSQAAGSAYANPSMSDDFQSIMGWLSDQMVQGLAFNTGSTFDPPHEVKGYRLQPDWSLGVGSMPLDKSKFPVTQTQALKDAGVENIFPAKEMFPNSTVHLRAGLPGRNDASFRFTDMTVPKGYKISNNTTGQGQSNSLGFGLRHHFLGGDLPALTLGLNYNHVFGTFKYHTLFGVNNVPGFTATTDVNGTIKWDLNSIGLNAVLSQRFGAWTPFAGYGLNRDHGSVEARLEVLADTPLINPVIGDASRTPETIAGRFIFGTEFSRSWANFFVNGEVKAMGINSGRSWIVQSGLNMPFAFGRSAASSRELAQDVTEERASAAAPAPIEAPKPRHYVPYHPASSAESSSKDSDNQLIFLQ